MTDGILNLNKPRGFTSHDAVAKLRGILRERRLGHGGTLDPMATGVLPILAGRATRVSEYILGSDKEYVAAFRLGIDTDTQDTTGTVVRTGPSDFTDSEVAALLPSFLGAQQQVPPMYSALKKEGQPLYKLARRGVDVPREPRRIEISGIEYLGSPAPGEHEIRVRCSKGTYIRTLCADIGQKLGTCAAMSALCRVRNGPFRIEDALSLDQVEDAVLNGRLSDVMLPLDSVFSHLPRVDADGRGTARVRNGAFADASMCAPLPEEDGVLCRVYGGGQLLMLGRTGRLLNGGRAVFCVKNFF